MEEEEEETTTRKVNTRRKYQKGEQRINDDGVTRERKIKCQGVVWMPENANRPNQMSFLMWYTLLRHYTGFVSFLYFIWILIALDDCFRSWIVVFTVFDFVQHL